MSAAGAGIARRLCLYTFLTDFVLLYPVYALLFADAGLSAGEISGLFVVWTTTSVLLEVPSGALADTLSRRALLTVAPLLSGLGFGLWVVAPSYGVFAVGFVLWGAKGALQSGTLEALVYEELRRLGDADRYGRVMGRARAAGTVAIVAATGLAAPAVAWGGYRSVGAASVVAAVACALVGATLPDRRDRRGGGERAGWREYLGTLRSGLSEVRRRRPALMAVVLVPAVATVWGGLEEYTPLVAAAVTDRPAVAVGLMVTIAAGTAVGGVLGGRFSRVSVRGVAGLLAVGAVGLAAGVAGGSAWGFGPIAVAFLLFEVATVVADVRLQDRIRGEARATVTSVAGLLTDLAGIGLFAGYGVASGWWGHPVLFGIGAAWYLLVAVALVRSTRARTARASA